MLMHPFLNIPYEPKLAHFLGGFDIYDREETLGEELSSYDIDCVASRGALINLYVVNRFAGLTYRHKFVLFRMLGETLKNSKTEVFSEVLEHDPFSHSVLPYGWDEMRDPKAFFEDIYTQLSLVWADEISRASQEDFSSW